MSDAFDYVIVGAGSAGCVLANRLSRDPAAKVLLLEAGDWDRSRLISIPMGAGAMLAQGLFQWPDISEPDAGLEGRPQPTPHGKVIGGTSSINYFAYTRGHPLDYDGWAAAGAKGWSFEDVLPFFRQIESWEGGETGRRGGGGEVGAVRPPIQDPIVAAWFDALVQAGEALTPDYNGEEPEGYGLLQYSIRSGRRSSSARAFLRPALKRPNLTVRTGAHVVKVLISQGRAVGVEYRIGGKAATAHSRARTVLCLGAINTPHLLMLSGIGPADHLSTMGVRPLVDLPVGQGLEDHLAVESYWSRKQTGSFHASLRADRVARNMLRAGLFGTGPAANLPPVIIGFIKTRPDLAQPDIEHLVQLPAKGAGPWAPGKPYPDGFGIRTQLMSQESRGEVLLRSGDPEDRPRIRHNSLTAPGDLAALREGVKRAWAIADSPALDDFRGAPLTPQVEIGNDAQIEAYIRRTALQQYHPACTCRMGVGSDAVVDPQLNVRGLEGLSIVDASVMPHLISGHPNLPVMMMAARAASLWS